MRTRKLQPNPNSNDKLGFDSHAYRDGDAIVVKNEAGVSAGDLTDRHGGEAV